MESTTRSDVPVSRGEAEKVLKRKLPASASNVYYLFQASGMQGLDFYLRFQVDAEQADAAVEDLLVESNRMLRRAGSTARSSLPPAEGAKPLVDRQGRFAPVQWWQPQTIRHGYYRGGTSSHEVAIWYDADHTTIYVHQTD